MDLNIVPINMHALQREIPLANLFNYSYTFERMVYERLAPHAWSKHCKDGKSRSPPATSTNLPEFAASMVADPYREVGATEVPLLRRLMVGGYNNHKPKYNSDQLWNKVLLQDSLPGDHAFLVGQTAAQGFRYPAVQSHAKVKVGHVTIGAVNKKLSYMPSKSAYGDQSLDAKSIKTVDVGNAQTKNALAKLGLVRHDTRLVRTLAWTTSLQKMIRVLMREQLHWIDTPVVQGIDALDPRITDYGDLDAFNSQEF
jgi:hypothetical protein